MALVTRVNNGQSTSYFVTNDTFLGCRFKKNYQKVLSVFYFPYKAIGNIYQIYGFYLEY